MIPRHYVWAGLDFLADRDGRLFLLEANKSTHMLGEYLHFMGDERPFQETAERMNAAGKTPCLLWRAGDPFPEADEDACFIARHLTPWLTTPPAICNVEENRLPADRLLTRSGQRVEPGSIFRWWYSLPWTWERAGVLVINPNCLWTAVRDKFDCLSAVTGAVHFHTPRSFPVATAAEAELLLEEHAEMFREGYVLKPRVGWGGYGVQVANRGDAPRLFSTPHVLSERIWPARADGRFWDVRVFVMNGRYLGGLRHTSRQPNTNYYQGGQPERLDDTLSARLEPAALEAVALLDQRADEIHRGEIPQTRLTDVSYS